MDVYKKYKKFDEKKNVRKASSFHKKRNYFLKYASIF
jgi:hypothetical protein